MRDQRSKRKYSFFVFNFQRFHAAENELEICLQIYKLCLPPNSFHYLVTKASLGLLYRQQRDYQKAIVIFQNIAQLLGKFFLTLKNSIFSW